jgi:hypothetical protein
MVPEHLLIIVGNPEFPLIMPLVLDVPSAVVPFVLPAVTLPSVPPTVVPFVPPAVLPFISDVPPIKPLVPPTVVPFVLHDKCIDRLINGSSEFVDGANVGQLGGDLSQFVGGGTVTLDWLVNGADIAFDGVDGTLVNGVDG